MSIPMQTEMKPQISETDLIAVRDFLLSGRELPRSVSPGRPKQRKQLSAPVPVHNGIVRARSRASLSA
jgi:hypothetical protein